MKFGQGSSNLNEKQKRELTSRTKNNMENEIDIEPDTAFALSFRQGVRLVTQYMKEQQSKIDGVLVKPEVGHREAALKGLWMRTYAWMRTIEKLNDPLDFQAIAAGNRALFEITVDLVLLHHDKSNASGWKMLQWSESEKMKSALLLIELYKELGVPFPEAYEAQKKFYENNKSIVDHMRMKLWPVESGTPAHPNRWTGKRNIFDDVLNADKLYCSVIKNNIGYTLTEYYRAEYPKMSWYIHSGVASFWNLPPEAYFLTVGFAYKACADFGMLCTKIILMDFGFNIAEDLTQEWTKVQNQRDIASFEGLGISASS